MDSAAPLALPPFEAIAERIRAHAGARPTQRALVQGDETLDYGALDALMDRVAAALQRDGVRPGESIAICAQTSPRYAAIFLGALRAGVAVAPLASSVTPQSFASMLADAHPRRLFIDGSARDALGAGDPGVPCIRLDDSAPGTAFDTWLEPAGQRPQAVEVQPDWPFNIIYSSGTTGTPKGIVQSHGMRWSHVERGAVYDYGPQTITLLATPLYSNTTLVVFFPTLAFGGTVVLMPRFDAAGYLRIAETERATHTMLVPVQYQRIMALPDFDRYDLRSFRFKFCTSAPFNAALKADVLARWPGGLIEFYGMTEGGGTCILAAHEHPDKLHTVGRPAEGHDIRLIDEAGRELPPGATGEVVGHSRGMMTGYHRQPEKTAEAEWFDPTGKRFIRTGDIGRFDADGFLTLLDRKKDLVISGGFNIYPSDLEAVLREHPAVADVAVVGVPSTQWGETPVAFVFRRSGDATEPDALKQWLNQRVGKTQRLADLRLVEELPRSAIGKVLKRDLRDRYVAAGAR
jgi:acyl-CoA synthetase (AMP-forming)/AMP-acid ligase II